MAAERGVSSPSSSGLAVPFSTSPALTSALSSVDEESNGLSKGLEGEEEESSGLGKGLEGEDEGDEGDGLEEASGRHPSPTWCNRPLLLKLLIVGELCSDSEALNQARSCICDDWVTGSKLQNCGALSFCEAV